MTSIIYEARGRAREYSELAANLYRGCGHGCTYCYAPAATRQKRENFCEPRVRKNVLKQLEKDALNLEKYGETRPVLLSFTTDPYQPLDEKEELTREAIKILHNHNIKIKILTKGGKRSERDFDLLMKKPKLTEYGVTLVFTNEKLRSKIEVNAAPTEERIEVLKKAHDNGIYTYVSLEPVWDPQQTLDLIDEIYEFVDFFKVGKLNHNSRQKEVDWENFKSNVIDKLEYYNKEYYIKKDLDKF
jgi:DNA repair photolyase